ncbi:MAG: HEAT repeat domain-containing protein [Candidatus Hodarchaeales archaeon]
MSPEDKDEIDPALRRIMDIPDDQELPDDALIDVMLRALESHQILIRSSAVHQLVDLGKRNPSLSLPKLLLALDPKVDFWTVRFGALEALGEIANKASIKPLIKYLNSDSDPDFRAMVAKQIGEMGDVAKEAGPELIKALKDKESSETRENAAHALGQVVITEAVEPLTTVLKTESNEYVKREICWSLGELKGISALPVLIDKIKDKDKECRANAAEALGKIEDGGGIIPILRATKDREVAVQAKAIKALKHFSDKILMKEIEKHANKDVFVALQLYQDYLFNIENDNVVKKVNEIKKPIIDAYKEKMNRIKIELESCKLFVEESFQKLATLSVEELSQLIERKIPPIESKIANISFYEFRKQKWIEDDLFFDLEKLTDLYKESGLMISELRDNAQKIKNDKELNEKQEVETLE